MFFKLSSILIVATIGVSNGVEVHQQSFDEAIKALRSSSKLSFIQPEASDSQTGVPSFVETESLKKPLSVAQFSEWLHNLYFNEKEKRDSAIKSLLANDPLRTDIKGSYA